MSDVRLAGSSALGRGAARSTVPTAARVAGSSALGRGSAAVWADFTASVPSYAAIYYVMDLVTPGGLVRVPISSWQATLDTDSKGYCQCVVPAVATWVDSIAAATEFVIFRQARSPSGAVLVEYEMARSPLSPSGISYDRGTSNWTATLSGYPDALTPNDNPPVVYDRALTGVRTQSNSSGGTRVRCAIDWLLRPGHRAYLDEVPIIVGYINYYVPGNDQYMDVGERI